MLQEKRQLSMSIEIQRSMLTGSDFRSSPFPCWFHLWVKTTTLRDPLLFYTGKCRLNILHRREHPEAELLLDVPRTSNPVSYIMLNKMFYDDAKK